MRHRGKGKFLVVRRFRRIVNQADLYRALLHFLREIEFWTEVLRNFSGKRNHSLRTRLQVQAANFSVLVVNNFLAAGEKRVARKKVAREDGFLIITRHRIADPVIFACLQIAQAQSAFCFVPRHIKQKLSIGGQSGPHGAARLLDDRVFLAGFSIFPLDLPQGKHRIVGKIASSLCVVQIPAITRSYDAHDACAILPLRRWRRF